MSIVLHTTPIDDHGTDLPEVINFYFQKMITI